MSTYGFLDALREVSPDLMFLLDNAESHVPVQQIIDSRLRSKYNMDDDETLAIAEAINFLLHTKTINVFDISTTLSLNGYYLKRTPYRIELRHKNSTTWLAYVMYRERDISPKEIARILKKKYLILIGNSLG